MNRRERGERWREEGERRKRGERRNLFFCFCPKSGRNIHIKEERERKIAKRRVEEEREKAM